VKKILNLWSYRDLTYIGKVTVIKTLALPILVQCLTVLPNPPDSILNDIEKIFYKFLWSCSWQLRLEPSHIASVLSKLTLSPAHSENLLSINND
jgi:hypothetical protein